jgi:non-homologous end joining protein Ku
MPRPLWSGAISFGLVTIPVKLMSATEDRSVRFHQVHTEDLGRVRVRKYCEAEDREVSAAEIGKGYEVSKDTLVAVTAEASRRDFIDYFHMADAGKSAVIDLFTDDAQMFYPKFGIANGKAQIGAFAQGLGRGIASLQHEFDRFTVL